MTTAQNKLAPTEIYDAVAQSAMIVQIDISTWSMRKTQRDLSSDVSSAHEADEKAFAVVKKLFPGGENLFREALRVQHDFKKMALKLTLPLAGSDRPGTRSTTRLLANARFKEFMQAKTAAEKGLDAALTEAIAGYKTAINAAKAHLGETFDESDYPEPEALRRKFSIRTDFLPVPQTAAFGKVALPDEAVEALRGQIEDDMSGRIDAMVESMEDRARTLCSRVIDRVRAINEASKGGSQRAVVHQSMFDDAKDLAGLFRDYASIMKSDKLSTIADKLEDIGAVSRDDMKKSRAVLIDVARNASAIMKDDFAL